MEKKIDKEFHYTKECMAKDLLKLVPYKETDTLLDAGSGKNKVWYKNFDCNVRYECEIEDGCDFYKWDKKVDWVIGNPPLRYNDKNQVWKWMEKSSEIARTGMAFLINHKIFNSFTPQRLEKLAHKGFYLQKIHIVSDVRWRGRFYFIVFGKGKSILSWKQESY